jgi:HK97 family phage major capsid protein
VNTFLRTIQLDHTRADDGNRTAPAVVSTEFPVDRGGYQEVLSHTPGSVDLSRAPLPLIESHDNSRINVGIVEGLSLQGGKLRGIIRLGTSARATELWNDIKAGIVRSLSVGYEWLSFQDRGEQIIVTHWRPHEVSLVAAPADPHAGLYRAKHMSTQTAEITEEREQEQPTQTPLIDRMTRAQKRNANAMAREERERVSQIYKIFEHFKCTDDHSRALRDEYITSGKDIDEVRNYFRSFRSDPVPVAPANPSLPYIQYGESQQMKANLRHFGNSAERAYTCGQWIRGVLFGDHNARAWLATRGIQSAGSAGSGGVLVPDELSSAIISLANDYGIARSHAHIWPMGSGTLSIPRRSSGITGGYIGEMATLPLASMQLDNINLVARKYAAMVRFTSELAEDSVIDIAALLSEEIAREFSRAEDEALFNGDATSTYGGISGILPNIVSTAGAVTAAAGHDTFSEVDATDLALTTSKLPSWARREAAWFVSPAANDIIFQRIGAASGGTTMIERGGVLLTSFGGYPIIVSESMPVQDDMSGKVMALFGRMDLAVAMGLRRDLRIRIDDASFAQYDQIGLYATERFDIVAHDIGTATAPGALVALIGAA